LADAPAAFGATLESWSGAGDTEDRWRQRLEDVPLNLVAMDGYLPIGQASGVGPDDRGRAELISMWVAPAARGTGVAPELIDAVAVWARGSGASALRLSVRRSNDLAIR
jgi:ribosomal protein S18 acetylase RimI-like enzyme